MQETNGTIGIGQSQLLSRFKDRQHSGVLPRLGKVTGAEDLIEDPGQEGNCSLRKMLPRSVGHNVRTRSLADLEAPEGFVNILTVS